jgi:hypothetical protein
MVHCNGDACSFFLLSSKRLAAHTLGIFRLSFAKFGPTGLRRLLAVGNTVLCFHPNAEVPGLHIRLFDFGGALRDGNDGPGDRTCCEAL